MRIISQDGIKFDIEYENFHLVVNEKCCEIEAQTSNQNFTPVMASYSSLDRCKKAMDMLHGKHMLASYYVGGKSNFIPPKIFKFPSEYEVEKALSETEA